MECVHRTHLPRYPRDENLEVVRLRRQLHHGQLQDTGTLPCLQVGSLEPAATSSSDPFILSRVSAVSVCAPVLHEKTADPETASLPPGSMPFVGELVSDPACLDSITGTAS